MKVITDRTRDFHDLDSLARDIVQSGLSQEEKAIACYDVVRESMFQYPWVYNVKERREEWHDAVKLLNIYGHGLCGVQARTLGALYQKVFGYENQRLIGLNERVPGDWELEKHAGAFIFSRMGKGYSAANPSGHSCVEVFYGGHWHHLDPMVQFYCYTRDGSRIASLEDTLADPSLVTHPSREIPHRMPDGDLGAVFYRSRFADWGPGPGYYMVMDTRMDVALREGQTLTYFWDREHGRFHWPDILAEKFEGAHFVAGPRHPDTSEGTWRHYGNGTFGTRANQLKSNERLRLPFPYVLVGATVQFVADANTRALWVTIRKEQVCEKEVAVKAGPNALDLGDFVMGGYDLDILPIGGCIDRLDARLFFQHNFITRPRLLTGENVVTVSDETDAPVDVLWEWVEAGNQLCRDERTVRPFEPYVVSVGELNTEPRANPKYMKCLRLSRQSGDTTRGTQKQGVRKGINR